MTKKTGLSPAEQSRLAAKAALKRQAAEREKVALENRLARELGSNQRAEEECKRLAVPTGKKILALLREQISAGADKGLLNLRTTMPTCLVALNKLGQEERLISHAFNYAAKKLREGGYKVVFGRPWSCERSNDQFGGVMSDSGILWGEDAVSVPRTDVPADYRRFYEAIFPNIEIEVVWGEE